MGNTRADKAKIMFATHPKVDEFYVTSNDKFFYTEQDAESAAQLLENNKVDKLERESVPANEELEKEIAASKANDDQSEASEDDKLTNPDGSQGEGGDDLSGKDEESPEPESDQAATALNQLKAEYKDLTGNPAHHTWDVAKIQEKIDEFKSSEASAKGEAEASEAK